MRYYIRASQNMVARLEVGHVGLGLGLGLDACRRGAMDHGMGVGAWVCALHTTQIRHA